MTLGICRYLFEYSLVSIGRYHDLDVCCFVEIELKMYWVMNLNTILLEIVQYALSLQHLVTLRRRFGCNSANF